MFYGLHPDRVERVSSFGSIVQIAYHAPDISEAADWFAWELKAGPFYLLEHIKLRECLYRGGAASFDHSSAYGQYGDVMIELIHQHDNTPSAVRDMFSENEKGLHHAAVFVDNLDVALVLANEDQMTCALDATTSDGVRFAMVDARERHGFMLEFYERNEALAKFYTFIRRKADGWNGGDVLRKL